MKIKIGKHCKCCGEIKDTKSDFCSDDCEAAYFTNFGDNPAPPKTQAIRFGIEPNGDFFVAE